MPEERQEITPDDVGRFEDVLGEDDSLFRRVAVKSTSISHAGYDRDTSRLLVVFRNGTTYIYDDVPLSVYDGLMTAGSAGRYLRQHVINAGYKYSKV